MSDKTRLLVGRMPTDAEWENLKKLRSENPQNFFKRGDTDSEGRVFMQYTKSVTNGERWVTAEAYERKKAQDRKRPKNPEYHREYYKRNSAKLRDKSHKNYHSNKEAISLREKLKSPEKKEAKRLSNKARYHRMKDDEGFKAKRREQNQRNREAAVTRVRNWKQKNRVKLNEYLRDRFKNDPLHNLRCSIRTRLWSAMQRKGFNKTTKTAEALGCDWGTFKQHIETLFKPGMSWDNRSEWHIDHIIPLSSATTEHELLKLCHYLNTQPLWASENLRKSDRILTLTS